MEYIYLFSICILSSFVIMMIVSLFFPSANIFFQIGIMKKYARVHYESEYFRDILTYSPSEILYIYNKCFKFKNNFVTFKMKKIRKLFSINLLKMNLLGYVDIDFNNKPNFKVIRKDVIILDKEYKFIYDYIWGSITAENEIFLYDIYDYVNQNYRCQEFLKWNELILNKLKKRGYYIGDFVQFYGDKIKIFYLFTIPIAFVLNVLVALVSLKTAFFVSCLFVLFFIVGYYETKNIKVLSNIGIYEYRKIIALKRFLKHFSTFDNRGPEYSKLMEDYVVYASIFNLLNEKIYVGNISSTIENILKK